MATLTETSFYARKYINYAAIGIVVYLILRFLFGLLIGYLQAAFPPVIKPNNAFGVLPPISFPESASPSAEITFKLQTISGTVPEASSTARIFFMPKERIGLLSLSQAQAKMAKASFTTAPRQLTETLYRWVDLASPLRTIEFDIISGQFTLQYLYQHDLTLFNEKDIPTPQAALSETLAFLRSLDAPFADIDTANFKFTYLRLVGNELQPASSPSQADAIRVDLFRTNYDGFPVVTSHPSEGTIRFIFSGSRRKDRRILYANYKHWPVDSSSPAIYAVKSSLDAWTEFIEGKAYIASLPQDLKSEIPITNVYLAYYDNADIQLYLQPVFVIEGEGGFAAYVPALAPPWTQASDPTPLPIPIETPSTPEALPE